MDLTPAVAPAEASQSSARIRTASFAFGAAILLVAMTAALYLGAVRTYTGQRADEAALVGRTFGVGVQNSTNRLLDTISVASLVLGAVALTLVALSRRRPRLAAGIVVAIVAATVTTELLKTVFLDRTDLLHRPGAPTGASFPSGHATVAMALALALLLVVPPRVRAVAGSVGFAYAVLVGAATLTAGWHRPSDVIGAFLIANTYAFLLVAVLVLFRGAGAPERRPRDSSLSHMLSSDRVLALATWILVIALVASAVVLLILNGRRLTSFLVTISYVGAVAAIAAVAALLLGMWLRLLRGVRLDPPAPPDTAPR